MTGAPNSNIETRQIAVAERARDRDRWGIVHAFPGVTNTPSNGICRSLGFMLLGERHIIFANRVLRTNHRTIDPHTDVRDR